MHADRPTGDCRAPRRPSQCCSSGSRLPRSFLGPHGKALAPLAVELERLRSHGLSAFRVGRFNGIFGTVAQDRDSPVTELGGGGLLYWCSHHSKIARATPHKSGGFASLYRWLEVHDTS